MEKLYANENLKENLRKLKEMGYKYIVKAKDNLLSGWGESGPTGHIQLIAAKDLSEVYNIIIDLKKHNTFSYINWLSINNYAAIEKFTINKSFTIRNDW